MDWKKLITDLEESGLTQIEIGRLADCSQSLVSELKSGRRGKRLDYGIGARLVALRKDRLPARRKDDIAAGLA